MRTTKVQISLRIRAVWSSAHPRSPISAFIVRCLDSIIPLVSISNISSRYLASVAAQAGLCLTWSGTPKTGFLVTRLNWYDFSNADVAVAQNSWKSMQPSKGSKTMVNLSVSLFYIFTAFIKPKFHKKIMRFRHLNDIRENEMLKIKATLLSGDKNRDKQHQKRKNPYQNAFIM